MSHRLEPLDGKTYLAPTEVVSRLRDEFRYCESDANQGADDVGDIIAKLIELHAPQPIIDEQIQSRDQAIRVTVSDDLSSEEYLSFIVQPGIGPLIGYSSAQHEAAVRPLLDRCAAVLNYEIVYA